MGEWWWKMVNGSTESDVIWWFLRLLFGQGLDQFLTRDILALTEKPLHRSKPKRNRLATGSCTSSISCARATGSCIECAANATWTSQSVNWLNWHGSTTFDDVRRRSTVGVPHALWCQCCLTSVVGWFVLIIVASRVGSMVRWSHVMSHVCRPRAPSRVSLSRCLVVSFRSSKLRLLPPRAATSSSFPKASTNFARTCQLSTFLIEFQKWHSMSSALSYLIILATFVTSFIWVKCSGFDVLPSLESLWAFRNLEALSLNASSFLASLASLVSPCHSTEKSWQLQSKLTEV